MERLSVGIVFPSLKRRFGAERLLIETATLLAEYADVTIYSPFVADDNRPKNVRVVTLWSGWNSHILQTIADWAVMPLLALKTRAHDVFIAMNYQGALGGALAARRHGRPLVYECTEPPRFLYDLADFRRRLRLLAGAERLLRRVDYWAVQQATEIVSISEWTANQVFSIYGRRSSILYPGISQEAITAHTKGYARTALGIDKDTRLYLSMSKLHPRKQLDQAIQMYRDREHASQNSLLCIAGEGPDRGRLEAIVAGRNSPPIRFLGYISERDRPLWLRAADIFLFVARDEPFGLAPLEAKVAGCEVIPSEPKYPITTPRENVVALHQILVQAQTAYESSAGHEPGNRQ